MSIRPAIHLLLLAALFPLLVSPANAVKISHLPGGNEIRGKFNLCVEIVEEASDGENIGAWHLDCCTRAMSACVDACQYDAKQVDLHDCYHPGNYSACLVGCFSAFGACIDGDAIEEVLVDPGFYVHPVHPTLFPDRRVDFCLESGGSGGVSCGAPAAHSFCERMHGPGWVASGFARDGIPATPDLPTWKLGTDPFDITSGEQCEGPECEGFEFIQCAEATVTYPFPSRFGLRIDECYLPGAQCGRPAADAFCSLKEDYGAVAVSWNTVTISSDTLVLGGPPVTTCDGPGCSALQNLVCMRPELPVNTSPDSDLDGVRDYDDNCIHVPNPLQENVDNDLRGDACDPTPYQENICENGLDDDADGYIDEADPGCIAADDASEHEPLVQCDDGLDNDLDGQTDLEDSECSDIADATEVPATCGNGVVEPEHGEVCDGGEHCSPACRLATRPGQVWAARKISDVAGGFTGVLDNVDRFGRAAGIGDIDGDGVPDLAVGAGNDDDGKQDGGAVYVLLLREDGSVKSHAKTSLALDIDPETTDRLFGLQVGSLGDLDGDGTTDLAVMAQGYPGAVYILFLRPDGSVRSHVRISNGSGGLPFVLDPYDSFGTGLARLDDMDGDGVPELAVGAPGDDEAGADRGAVYVLFLRSDGTVKDSRKISTYRGTTDKPIMAIGDKTRFGGSVAAIGDLDGDGVGDLAASVGCEFEQECATLPGERSGGVLLLFLNPDATVKGHRLIKQGQGFYYELPGLQSRFGGNLTALGDLDGDGVVDLGVSAPGEGEGGQLWILFLRPTGSIRHALAIENPNAGAQSALYDNFGLDASLLGDLDGDGLPELAVGAVSASGGGSTRGAVHILSITTNLSECGDGHDNDEDGLADLADPNCKGSPWHESEAAPTRPSCGLGLEPALFLPQLAWIRRRRAR